MKSTRSLLLIALLMGLITSVLVFAYVRNLSQPVSQEVKMVAVVVAERRLLPRTMLYPEDLAIMQVPIDLLNPDAIVDAREAQGRIVKEAIAAGEQILRSRLFPPGEVPGLPFAIPSGKRAVTIAVNEVIGVAGFIKPGDYVDILATLGSTNEEMLTIAVLQNVQVLAVAQDMNADLDEEPRVTTTLTVAVTLEEAQRLTLAEERGLLRVVLRPVDTKNREVARVIKDSDLAASLRPRPTASTQQQTASQRSTSPPQRPIVTVSRPDPDVTTVEVIRGIEKTKVEVSVK